MESRTRWRKGEPGLREGVAAVLEALRESIGAEAVGLFDDDRAELSRPGHAVELNLWEAFGGMPCLDLEWSSWYGALKREGQVSVVCACGEGHQVRGYQVNERWVVLLVTAPVLATGAAAAISSALKALGDKLPPGRKLDPSWPGSDPALASARGLATAPLWWVGKTRQ